ncbi:hypothetical protein ATCC90586_011494 [Pythium insidiosum]|nr:hypothetical protein ATCC90586_011494 [Pythium insidiosum]
MVGAILGRGRKRKAHDPEHLQDAAERVINGEKARLVSQDEGIAYSTLMKYVSLIRSGHEIDVIAKANAILAKLDAPPVGTGWYKRFLERHPLIVMRQAQVVSRLPRSSSSRSSIRLAFTKAGVLLLCPPANATHLL